MFCLKITYYHKYEQKLKLTLIRLIGDILPLQIEIRRWNKVYSNAILYKLCNDMVEWDISWSNIEPRTLERIDKMHIDIARNIQGMDQTHQL